MEELINKAHVKSSLLQFMKKYPQSIRHYSKDIGISAPTLKSFLIGNSGDYKTVSLIDNYLEKVLQGYESSRK